MTQKSSNYRTVKRVLDALEQFANTPSGLTVTEMSTQLEMPLSSAQVLLRELEKYGFLRVSGGKRFVAGARLHSLAARLGRNNTLAEVARPRMHELANLHGEDVYLGVPQQDMVVYIEVASALEVRYRLDIPLGQPRPLHASAAGQVFLAFQTPEVLERLVANLKFERLTAHTITTRSGLYTKLAQIRAEGYVITHEECIDGVVGISTVIRDSEGLLIGVLTLSVLKGRLRSDDREGRLTKALAETGHLISEDLGWTGSAFDRTAS